VMDVHNYPAPIAPKAEPNRAIVLGEFGGLGLAVEGHTWKKENWGYRGMIDAEQLTTQYEKYLKKVYELKDSPGLSAAVYTQTTDVEIECNGLLTYDRAIVKPNLARVAAANKGDFSLMPPEPIVKMVIPTSEGEGRNWRYTLEKPGDAWMKPDFDDTKWMAGQAGFGKKETPGGVIRTEWTTNDIWLRTEFELPDKRYTNLQFRIHHDDDAEVYVNGVLAASYGRYTVEYEETPMLSAGRKAFRPGKNVIAVHCLQKRGGQYIDVGLVDVIPTRRSK